MQKFELVEYSDVWGNPDEGFEVNNVSRTGIIYQFRDICAMSDAKLIKKLKTEKKKFPAYRYYSNYDLRPWLSKEANENTIEISGDDAMIEFSETESGFPLGRLELIS